MKQFSSEPQLEERVAELSEALAVANAQLANEAAERKRAEAALQESERGSRLIVDTIPGLIAVLATDGRVEIVSRRIIEYTGRTLEEFRHWDTGDIVHPDDLPHVVKLFTESIASGTPFEITQRLRRSDGVYRWFQNSGFPVRDADAHIVQWCVLMTDIDEQNRAEDARKRSERNLKLVIDTIPALAWSARPDGTVEFLSQSYLDFIGFAAERANDWGWTAAVHPDDLDALLATWQRIVQSQEPGEAEARLRHCDGSYRWFLFRVNPLRDENGNVANWYGINTDIEDRKQAEAELRRAYDSFADAERLSKTGNFTADIVADDHIWSEELFRIFELDPATKVTVQAVRDIIHPEDLPAFDGGFAHSLGGAPFDLVFRIFTPSGNTKHVHAVAHMVERLAGRPLFIGAIQDVTESMQAEETLNRTRSELARVTRLTTLSTLTASIAHEVNQPLSGIITNASTCLRMLDSDPPNLSGARETARRTIRDGNRASEVVQRVRALFSRKEFTLEPVDLSDATREVLALSSSDLQRNRVIVESELADDLPLVIGDRVQLQQVIVNLLRNASDAMIDVDDRPRRVFVKTGRDDDRVRVTVQDTGIGIDHQTVDRLFDAFYTTKSGGMGIGLSVSRSIIDSLGGDLWAKPNDGPGATFGFSIPIRAGG